MKKITLENAKFDEQLPKNLLHVGTFIISLGILILLTVGYLLEYSDKIIGNIVLTTPTLPIEIPAEADGTLQFLIENEQEVEKDQLIALIESPTKYEDVRWVQEQLKEVGDPLEKARRLVSRYEEIQLGDYQDRILLLKEQVNRYQNFIANNPYAALIKNKKENLALYQERIALIQEKYSLNEQDRLLAEKQSASKSRLAERQIIAQAEYERTVKEELASQIKTVDNKASLNELQMQIKQLEREILENQSAYTQEKATLSDNVVVATNALAADLQLWEERYLIKAVKQGKVIFKEELEDQYYIQKGKTICTILPLQISENIGQLAIALDGAAKVKQGQDVNVLLSNYPPSEYGILKGKVERIAPLPEKGLMRVEVALPDTLTSTYGITFDFQQLANGKAEIITNKLSFAERIWNEIKGRRLNQ
ncbi:MAG: hypothetical protein AAGG68_25260 [Bacteroidota bacterium]